MVWLWSITVVIWVRPSSLGISLGCLAEILAVLWFVYMTTFSTSLMGEALSRSDLFERCVKRAWLQARNGYLGLKNVLKISDVSTYEELYQWRNAARGHVNTAMSRSTSKKVKPSSEGGTDAAEQELLELYGELSITQRNLRKAFKDEVRLLIHFELLLIVSIVQIMVSRRSDNWKEEGRGWLKVLECLNVGPIRMYC